MLLPTQDKEAIKVTIDFMTWAWEQGYGFDAKAHTKQHETERIAEMSVEVLSKLEELGYHKGLPTSIEEALNSGDGVYRP